MHPETQIKRLKIKQKKACTGNQNRMQTDQREMKKRNQGRMLTNMFRENEGLSSKSTPSKN
jgi:hypothetical protein